MGRPQKPIPQGIADALLDHLHDGGSLKAFCAQDGMPKARTISDWKAKDAEFAAAYARAREDGAHIRFDNAGEIVATADRDNWQVAKLRADHEYRAARSFCPAVFGDKHQHEHGGGINISVVTGVPHGEDEEES